MLEHILRIIVNSAIATYLLLPVSSLDIYYAATFHQFWWPGTFFIIWVVDVLMALGLVRAGYAVRDKVIRSEKNKRKLELWGNKFKRWGFWGILLASATPLPYSIALYAQSVVKITTTPKLILAVTIGRFIKYAGLTVAIILGYNWLG